MTPPDRLRYAPELKFAKPRPRALMKLDRVKAKQSVEDQENAIVKARSKGQCEVIEVFETKAYPYRHRCLKTARHIHHFLGGIGRRGVKESALAINKLHVCAGDHDLITRHVLQPHWTDVNDRAGTTIFIRLK